MKHELFFDENRHCFIVRTHGDASVKGFDALVKSIVSHPQWQAGMNVLLDHRDLEQSHLKASDIQKIARVVGNYRKEYGDGRSAFVLSKSVDFGLARMWQGYSEDRVDFESKAFYNMDEAIQWLLDG